MTPVIPNVFKDTKAHSLFNEWIKRHTDKDNNIISCIHESGNKRDNTQVFFEDGTTISMTLYNVNKDNLSIWTQEYKPVPPDTNLDLKHYNLEDHELQYYFTETLNKDYMPFV